MEHTLRIDTIENHRYFSHAVKCACGWTAYAVDSKQADEHKKFHEDEIEHFKAREAAGLAKQSETQKTISQM